jgi:cell division protein FtsQ
MDARRTRSPAPKPAKAAVAPLPRGGRTAKADLVRLLPSGRSLLVGFALLTAGILGYFGARESSLFSIQKLEISGGGPRVRAEVRSALEPVLGRSLVGFDGGALERRLDALPDVQDIRYDRAFPHTLRIRIVPERPVAVLRRGREAWLVSARGRVMRPVSRQAAGALPRVWVPRAADVSVGATLADPAGTRAIRAVAPLAAAGFPARVSAVDSDAHHLTLILASGIEVRLGDTTDLALKLAVAGQIVRSLPLGPTGSEYVDVSVPERPVASDNSQLGG